MHSCFFNWADLKVTPTKQGRAPAPVFDAPTPTLSNLEFHISTLNPRRDAAPPATATPMRKS